MYSSRQLIRVNNRLLNASEDFIVSIYYLRAATLYVRRMDIDILPSGHCPEDRRNNRPRGV